PKATVQIGDVISGNASIYFDYNPPIITNTVFTEVIENLSVNDFSFDYGLAIYPNPTNDYFKVEKSSNVNIESIRIYKISGKLKNNSLCTEIIENLIVNDFSIDYGLAIYPNPTNDYFKVEKSSNVNIESIRIYNISGKLVKEFAESERYNVSDLNSGIYFLRIKTDKSQTIKKLVKS